ncbi:MAG TPA: LysR family transcriptional regulator [Alphaproteobacteria bacterium]|jgi:DNA-binding transcriptional LysR family regulator
MHDKIPDLNSLRIFAKVAEKQSFTAASMSLGISQSLVSKCIKRLEDDLGVKLLLRSPRQISLTDAGRDFYAYCARILDEVGDAVTAARRINAEVSGHLRVFSTQGVGQMLVLPVVSSFMRSHPAITVDLMLGSLINLIEHHIDLAIRMTNKTDPALHHTSMAYKNIATLRLVACASPAYLRNFGTPQRPEELVDHNCLLHSSKTTQSTWYFHGPQGRYGVHPSGTFSSNTSSTILEAALQGCGIGLFLQPAVAGYIQSGQLVSLFPEPTCSTRTLTAIYPRAEPLPRKLAVFLDHLTDYYERAFGAQRKGGPRLVSH